MINYLVYQLYLKKYCNGVKDLQGLIGVISPYKSQVKLLKNLLGPFCRKQQCQLQDTIEVNTVDAFQGKEKDIIIFNCVRSNTSASLQASLGFLNDERRLNVAITRPKHFLIILGIYRNAVIVNILKSIRFINWYQQLVSSLNVSLD